MAEPDLRDPASPEPARRPGPQPVRAASPEVPALVDPARELPATTSSQRTSSGPATRTRTGTGARAPKARTASQEMLEELRRRLEELRERVEKQTSEAGVSLKRELSQDADYVKIRARYYHERRPLQALGMVAAAGFVFGVFVGLWRR